MDGIARIERRSIQISGTIAKYIYIVWVDKYICTAEGKTKKIGEKVFNVYESEQIANFVESLLNEQKASLFYDEQ